MSSYFLTDSLSYSLTGDPSADKHYCIFVGARVFYGSQAVVRLLDAIDRESELERIAARVNASATGRALTHDEIRDVIDTRLIAAGLVTQTAGGVGATPKKRSFLFFARTLLNAKLVGIVSRPFAGLFAPRLAAALALASLALLGTWLWLFLARGQSLTAAQTFNLTLTESALFYGLLLASFLFHEIGHAAASRRFGALPAEIGVGLYLMFPVFYCNVTESWRLPRAQRVAVGAGGAYFQALAAALLVPLQFYTGSDILNLVIAANIISILVTLNPFFRFDGYWIYSDVFRIPNLRERSGQLTAALVRRVSGMPARAAGHGPGPVPLALRAYALGSALFFSVFTMITTQATWDVMARAPAMVQGAMLQLNSEPTLEMVLDIAASALTFLIYLGGCTLMFVFIVAAMLRGGFALLRAYFPAIARVPRGVTKS